MRRSHQRELSWLYHHETGNNGYPLLEGFAVDEPRPCEAADLSEFVRWGKSRRKLAERSVRSYLVWIRDAERFMHRRGGCLVTADSRQLEAYLDTVPQTAPSHNGARASLRAWFSFLQRQGIREDDPTAGLEMWKQRAIPAKPVDPQLIVPFLNECELDSPMLAAMSLVFLGTALRLDELRLRKWGSLIGKRLFVIRKGGGEKVVVLSKEARLALAEWRRVAPKSEWMWPSPLNPTRPVSGEWVYVHIREAGERAGIDRMHPHRLRHTSITEYYRLTKDALKTQQFAGHSGFAMTRRYIEVVDLESDLAIENLRFRTSTDPP